MRLALAQFGVARPAGFDDFVDRIAGVAHEARNAGAEMLVLPEYAAMVLAGAYVATPDVAAELREVSTHAEALVAELRGIARQAGLFLLGGSLPMPQSDGRTLNRAPFIAPSGECLFQDKRMMTRVEAETWGMSGGGAPNVFETPFGLIGVSVCYDAEFPLHVRAQVAAGAQLILVPSCTDALAGFYRVRLCARARAIENQCFVAMAPLVGAAPWSAAIDENRGFAGLYGPADYGFPQNGVLARGYLDEPGLVYAEVDFGRIDEVRRQGAVLNHADWPDLNSEPCPILSLS